MNSGKIIGLSLSAIIVLLMGYMIIQDTSSNNNTTAVKQEVQEIEKKQVIAIQSEEEKKLEDLKRQSSISMNNKVSQLYSLRCKACHGSEGQGSQIGPSIKGKNVEYILSKLDDYKNNRVTNSLMQGLLTNATQEELNTLAQEISSFK